MNSPVIELKNLSESRVLENANHPVRVYLEHVGTDPNDLRSEAIDVEKDSPSREAFIRKTEIAYPFSETYPPSMLFQFRQLYSYLIPGRERGRALPGQMRHLADKMENVTPANFAHVSPKLIADCDCRLAAGLLSEAKRLRDLPSVIKGITNIINELAESPVVRAQIPQQKSGMITVPIPEPKTIGEFDPRG